MFLLTGDEHEDGQLTDEEGRTIDLTNETNKSLENVPGASTSAQIRERRAPQGNPARRKNAGNHKRGRYFRPARGRNDQNIYPCF